MSTATLTWTPPVTRADGSPLAAAQIASAQVFDGATQIGSVTGAVGTFVTGALAPGAHSFTVTTTDTDGNVSAASNAATVTVSEAAPAAVTNLAVVLN